MFFGNGVTFFKRNFKKIFFPSPTNLIMRSLTRSLQILFFVIPFFGITLVVGQSQPKRPVGTKDFTVPHPSFGEMNLIGTHCECNNLNDSGVPKADKSARRFFYFPFLALKKINNEIAIREASKDVVKIPLVFSTADTREIFKRHLITEDLITKDIKVGNIQMATLDQVEIRTEKSYFPIITFDPIPVDGSQNTIEISARISDANIRKKFIDDFKKGDVGLECLLMFEGYELLYNNATITYEQLRKSQTYDELNGKGEQGFVTRKRMGDLAADVLSKNSVSVRTEFEDPNFMILVNELLGQLKAEKLTIEQNLSNLVTKFNEAGINPNEFAADVINSSKLILNQENQRKFTEEVNKHRTVSADGKGEADILGIINIGGSGSASFTKDDVRKVMEDVYSKYGIDKSVDGNIVIPKSIQVYRFEDSKLHAKATYSVGTAKLIKQQGAFRKIIDPKVDFFTFIPNVDQPISSQFVPIGTILPFAGEKIPEGYFLCNGDEKDLILHKPLHDVIGNRWGSPADPKKFKVPNLQGQFLRGLDPTGKVDEGRKPEERIVGSTQEYSTALPTINKFFTGIERDKIERDKKDEKELHVHTIPASVKATSGKEAEAFLLGEKEKGEHKLTFEIPRSEGKGHVHKIEGGGDLETRPKNIAVNYIIKYK